MKTKWFSTLTAGSLRLLRKSFGLVLVLAAFHGTAWGFDPVPEIDPGSAGNALVLLAGGVLLLYDRYCRR